MRATLSSNSYLPLCAEYKIYKELKTCFSHYRLKFTDSIMLSADFMYEFASRFPTRVSEFDLTAEDMCYYPTTSDEYGDIVNEAYDFICETYEKGKKKEAEREWFVRTLINASSLIAFNKWNDEKICILPCKELTMRPLAKKKHDKIKLQELLSCPIETFYLDLSEYNSTFVLNEEHDNAQISGVMFTLIKFNTAEEPKCCLSMVFIIRNRDDNLNCITAHCYGIDVGEYLDRDFIERNMLYSHLFQEFFADGQSVSNIIFNTLWNLCHNTYELEMTSESKAEYKPRRKSQKPQLKFSDVQQFHFIISQGTDNTEDDTEDDTDPPELYDKILRKADFYKRLADHSIL